MENIKRALISVSHKQGLVAFARRLTALNVQIISTGGTARTLRDAGLAVTEISQITGFPEILDGRVKTLHPNVHAGILALRDNPAHLETLKEHGIEPIDLVVVNLYPFSETVQRKASEEETIENIDIGGPTMLRSAAKNFAQVVVVVDPADYQPLIDEMQASNGQVSPATRRRLAQKVFEHTAAYEIAIASWFQRQAGETLPASFFLEGQKTAALRYGENPFQQAAAYASSEGTGILNAAQLQGKEMSFNNFADADAALSLVADLSSASVNPSGRSAAAIIKHANPCGSALGDSPADAFAKALACDPVSAFGGIVAFNSEVDELASASLGAMFLEVVVAPGYAPKALEVLASKRNLRVLEVKGWQYPPLVVRMLSGGFLVQQSDATLLDGEKLSCVTSVHPTAQQEKDLVFAWAVAKHVKSNAIVVAKDGATIGVGAGQMNRVGSVEIALHQAGEKAKGAVLASDGFFPFPDSVELAAQAGIAAIIQPGGSVKDKEVIAAAEGKKVAMLFTGVRHFWH